MDGIHRYCQSATLEGGYAKGEPIYDGIAEIWVDSTAVLRANAQTDAYAAVTADEANFMGASELILATEHIVKNGPVTAGGVKQIEFVRRKPDMAVEDFQNYWRTVHGPVAAEIPQMRRYTQSHALPGAYRDGRNPLWDGIACAWFDSLDDMRAAAQTEAYAANIADIPAFLADARPAFVIADEVVIAG